MFIADYYNRAFGLESTIISSYGPDFVPYVQPPQKIKLLPAKPNHPKTLLFRNIITPDSRQWFAENTAFADEPLVDGSMKAALESADLFIFTTILPNYSVKYVKQLFSFLPENCLTAFVCQGYLRHIGQDSKITTRDFPEAKELLPLFDLTVLSDEDHPDSKSMAHGWKKNAAVRNIVLTHGPKGASVIAAEDVLHIPTKTLADHEIIDSVGCGDIFLGSLAYNYWQQRDLAAAIKKAHEAAREKLTAPIHVD